MTAVVLIAACDDADETTTPTEDTAAAAETAADVWASSVCGALATWEESIRTITADTSDGISKDTVSEMLGEAEEATQDMVASLRDVGAPDTDAGSEARTAISEFADGLDAGVEAIRSDLDDLADSDAAGVASGVTDIVTQLRTLGADAQATLDEIQSLDAADALKTAIENDETCQSLGAT